MGPLAEHGHYILFQRFCDMGSVDALSPLRIYVSQGIDESWFILNTLKVFSISFLKLCAFDVHHQSAYFIIPKRKLLGSDCKPWWIKIVAFIKSRDGSKVGIKAFKKSICGKV